MRHFKNLLRFGLAAVMATTMSFAVAQDLDQEDLDQDSDDSKEKPTLVIGAKAPELDIEHWLSDNDGLYPQVKKFEADKIYVIDFWSTRSPGSIFMMHQLGKIQSDYESKDVQIIGVSVEDLDTVEDFLERKSFGGEDADSAETFADVTRSFCLTTDPDESVWNDYVEASGSRQSTFIIGKTGLLEWIGNSSQMKEPLDKVIAGKWDRDEFKKKFTEAQKNAKEIGEKLREAMLAVREEVQDGNDDKAIELLTELIDDEVLQTEGGQVLKPRLNQMRSGLFVKLIDSEHDASVSMLKEFVEKNKADAGTLNTVTWSIYEHFEEKGGDVDAEVLKVARKGAEYAAKAEPESGAILDTLAHYIYIVDEDLDKAIEVQQKAVEHAGVQLEDIKPFLDELLEEKETGKKKKKKRKVSESDF